MAGKAGKGGPRYRGSPNRWGCGPWAEPPLGRVSVGFCVGAIVAKTIVY